MPTKKDKPLPVKLYFDVKVEVLLPATLTYRILAETPQQAVEKIKGMTPNTVKYKLAGKKNIKLMVYDAGCSVIKLILNNWK